MKIWRSPRGPGQREGTLAQRPGLRVQGPSVANAQGRGGEGGWDPTAKGPGLSAEESGLHPTAGA